MAQQPSADGHLGIPRNSYQVPWFGCLHKPVTPGTIIAIPAEVKHWHGAAKDSWFQHLTYHKDVQEGASNEWLEPVTDDVYDKLK